MGPALAAPASSADSAPAVEEATPAAPTTTTKSSRWYDWALDRAFWSRFSPSISTYYATSVADFDSSDFGHTLGFWGHLDVRAMPSLFVSSDLTLYRDFGEEDERFEVSNWRFGVTRTVELPYAGLLYPEFFFKLPTNGESREYFSYRGTMGLGVELRKFNFYKFHDDHSIGGSAGLTTARNIFEFTDSVGGFPNTLWQFSTYASLSYKFRSLLMATYRFSNTWNWQHDGRRTNDTYRMSISLYGHPIEPLWVGISLNNSSRTFLYDDVSWNVSIYDAEATSWMFLVTYVPKIEKTHELSR
jgi:hypothetical protein